MNGNTNITGTLYVTLGPSVFADIEASNVTANNFTATAVNGTSTLAGGFTVTGNVGIATTTPKPYSLWVGLPLVLWLSSAAVPEKIDVGTVDPPYTIRRKALRHLSARYDWCERRNDRSSKSYEVKPRKVPMSPIGLIR